MSPEFDLEVYQYLTQRFINCFVVAVIFLLMTICDFYYGLYVVYRSQELMKKDVNYEKIEKTGEKSKLEKIEIYCRGYL